MKNNLTASYSPLYLHYLADLNYSKVTQNVFVQEMSRVYFTV